MLIDDVGGGVRGTSGDDQKVVGTPSSALKISASGLVVTKVNSQVGTVPLEKGCGAPAGRFGEGVDPERLTVEEATKCVFLNASSTKTTSESWAT